MKIDIAGWYKKYGPMVFRRCRAILRNDEEAMDAAQDVFANILKASDRLNDRAGEMYPSSFLYTAATNVCLNRLRRCKAESADGGNAAETEVPVNDSSYDRVDAEMLLQTILSGETEEDRTILYMYRVDLMTLEEIGKAVGLSISGVRKRMAATESRARRKA